MNGDYTDWYKWDNEKNKWVFNHREPGHSDRDKPEPKFKEQEIWNSLKWKKETGS